MCQQQKTEVVDDVQQRAADIARRIENMKQSGMPDRAIKMVERMLLKKQKESDFVSNNPMCKDEDILAMSTRYLRIVLDLIDIYYEKFQTTKAYIILTKTSQPAHLILAVITLAVVWSAWPLEDASNTIVSRNSGLAQLVYLGSFATHFGAQIWMTFVSGLALYFGLPAHTFGQCQEILFPKYFTMGAGLGISTLVLFANLNKAKYWDNQLYIQAVALALAALIELGVRLYLIPPTVRLMHAMHTFESAIEGTLKNNTQLEKKDLSKCPRYQMIRKKFRKTHMSVAMCNMAVLLCAVIHLHYLSQKITIS